MHEDERGEIDMTTHSDEIAETLGLEGRRGLARRLIRWGVLLALLLLAGFFVLRGVEKAQTPKPIHYLTENARQADLTVTVTATGTLEPTNEVEVGSEVSGILDTVEVDFNDYVKVGQVLARVNTDMLRAQIQQSEATLQAARASLAEAEVNVRETENELTRLKELQERTSGRLPSQHDMDAAVAARDRAKVSVDSAKAQVSQAEATLDVDQTNLEKSVVKSPIDGVVLNRAVDPGQTIAASFQAPVLFTLAENLKQMELHVAVDEADVGAVKEGQKASFTVDAYPGRSFPGRITEVRYASTTTNGVVTYEAVLSVRNEELLLRPGMTATADIVVHSAIGALVVPNAALRFTPAPETGEAAPQEGLLSRLMILPPESQRRQAAPETPRAGEEAKVWRLSGGRPEPVQVKLGLTDGRITEILEGDVRPDTPLVIEAVQEEI
jgi:HlyD family secretion protein